MDNNSTHSGKGLLEKTLLGGQWYFANAFTQRILSIGTFFVTARLLTPSDFGIISIAAIYPTMLDALTAIAFDTALVPLRRGEEKHYLNVVWTFTLCRTILIFLIVFFSAPLVAMFFHSPESVLLFRLSGLAVLIQGMANVGQVYFTIQLDFKKFLLRDIVAQSTISILSIGIALLTRQYWALFVANAFGSIAGTLMTYILSEYRPQLDFHFQKLKPLLPYGRWLYGQEILNQSIVNIENILVGRFGGTYNIGLYTKAKGLAQMPTSVIASLVSKVGFSAFAGVHDSPNHIREGFYKSTDLLMSVALPFLVTIMIAGEIIITIVLGEQWEGMVTMLQILAVPATLDVLFLNSAKTIFNAMNRPRFHFLLNMIYLPSVTVGLFLLVPTLGTTGAAIAILIASVVTNLATLYFLHIVIHPEWKRVLTSFFVTGTGILFALPFAMWSLRLPITHTFFGFLFLGICMSAIYFFVLYYFAKQRQKGPFPTLALIGNSFVGRFKTPKK